MGEVFVGSEAIAAAALTEHQLRRWYRTIFRDVYMPKPDEPSLHDRVFGAWLWSRRRAVIAGVAASALHGAQWVDADTPIELVAKNARPQRGLIVRNETLGADEVTTARRLPVTSLARTAFDLGRHLPRGQALARLDALMRAIAVLLRGRLHPDQAIRGCPWSATARRDTATGGRGRGLA